jgi:RNA polymerase sigma factor (sigma-70 family)
VAIPAVSGEEEGEATLLAELEAGDERAFERLVREQGPRLLAVSRRFLRNEEDARDAVQEAFLSAFRSLAKFEHTSKISTWLHRIAVNCCLMRLRTRRRKPEQPIEDFLPQFAEDGHQLHPSFSWKGSAETLLEEAPGPAGPARSPRRAFPEGRAMTRKRERVCGIQEPMDSPRGARR